MKTAIACASGSAKGVFVHGVIDALIRQGLAVDAFAASSSSTIPAAFAAAGRLDALAGPAYWQRTADAFKERKDVSDSIAWVIAQFVPILRESLFSPDARRFILAASHVKSAEAAEKCQGSQARRAGLDQLALARKKDGTWADANLVTHLFDTQPRPPTRPLTAENLADALYATTRMMHAWKAAGWIDGLPYVDASYTCSCPAIEMAELGYDRVVAISPETGPFYRDLYQREVLPPEWKAARISFIQPEIDLKTMGVDYLFAEDGALGRAFAAGRAAGTRFLDSSPIMR